VSKKIWRTILDWDDQNPAERVLSRCGDHDAVDCWRTHGGALEVAVFLECHTKEKSVGSDGTATMRVAYRTFHPEPVHFTMGVTCEGGRLGEHEAAADLQMMAGRSGARRYRTGIVPGGVVVENGEHDTQVDSDITLDVARLRHDGEDVHHFSVVFPGDGLESCPCC
jgi:hypothetical protein